MYEKTKNEKWNKKREREKEQQFHTIFFWICDNDYMLYVSTKPFEFHKHFVVIIHIHSIEYSIIQSRRNQFMRVFDVLMQQHAQKVWWNISIGFRRNANYIRGLKPKYHGFEHKNKNKHK